MLLEFGDTLNVKSLPTFINHKLSAIVMRLWSVAISKLFALLVVKVLGSSFFRLCVAWRLGGVSRGTQHYHQVASSLASVQATFKVMEHASSSHLAAFCGKWQVGGEVKVILWTATCFTAWVDPSTKSIFTERIALQWLWWKKWMQKPGD